VPTKYKDFAPGKDHVEKVDLCKGYWNPPRKTGVATHFFEIISLESQHKMLTSAFSEKRRRGYFFTDFLRIRLYKQKSKHIHKDLKTSW